MGLRLGNEDPDFKARIDHLDAEISRRTRQTESCANIYVTIILILIYSRSARFSM